MVDRQVEYRKTKVLKPHPNNVRNHSGAQIRRLAESIRQFGFTSPALIDENDVTLAGHARVLAAKKRGLTEIPVIVLRGLSEAKKRAYVLADNKIAEMAGYDRSALVVELQDLSVELAKEGLDLVLTGFNEAEFDTLKVDLVDAERVTEEDIPEVSAKPVSRLGDMWELGGGHRILCADSRQADYEQLMGPDRAAMLFGDLPYKS